MTDLPLPLPPSRRSGSFRSALRRVGGDRGGWDDGSWRAAARDGRTLPGPDERGWGWTADACSGATASCGWYTAALTSGLRLGDPTLVVEERRIVVTAAELTQLRLPLQPPASAPVELLLPRILYGGELLMTDTTRPQEPSVGIRLPAPLARGQEHEVGLSVMSPIGGSHADHHLFTCTDRCDLLIMRVRFPRGRTPVWVRRVDGLAPTELATPARAEELMAVDSVGEVDTRFHGLRAGRSYGFTWDERSVPGARNRPAGGRHRGAPAGGFSTRIHRARGRASPTNG